jgi:hypothetical protein
MHRKMGAGLHGLSLEPFPLFIDSSPLPSPKILMNMNGFQLYTPPARSRRPRISVPARLSNYLQVRYYQYEVTFGLYMMTLTEKIILNTILFTILVGILYGFYVGLEQFVVDTVCKIVYCITGSITSAPVLCASWAEQGRGALLRRWRVYGTFSNSIFYKSTTWTFFSATMTMNRSAILTNPPGNIWRWLVKVVTTQGLYRKNLVA